MTSETLRVIPLRMTDASRTRDFAFHPLLPSTSSSSASLATGGVFPSANSAASNFRPSAATLPLSFTFANGSAGIFPPAQFPPFLPAAAMFELFAFQQAVWAEKLEPCGMQDQFATLPFLMPSLHSGLEERRSAHASGSNHSSSTRNAMDDDRWSRCKQAWKSSQTCQLCNARIADGNLESHIAAEVAIMDERFTRSANRADNEEGKGKSLRLTNRLEVLDEPAIHGIGCLPSAEYAASLLSSTLEKGRQTLLAVRKHQSKRRAARSGCCCSSLASACVIHKECPSLSTDTPCNGRSSEQSSFCSPNSGASSSSALTPLGGLLPSASPPVVQRQQSRAETEDEKAAIGEAETKATLPEKLLLEKDENATEADSSQNDSSVPDKRIKLNL